MEKARVYYILYPIDEYGEAMKELGDYIRNLPTEAKSGVQITQAMNQSNISIIVYVKPYRSNDDCEPLSNYQADKTGMTESD